MLFEGAKEVFIPPPPPPAPDAFGVRPPVDAGLFECVDDPPPPDDDGCGEGAEIRGDM